MAITKVSDFSISDFPADTTFLLDTNVLYFVHSGYYMPTNPKSQIYSNLLQQLLSNGRKIVLSALNIQELLYGIENKEYELYLQTTHQSRQVCTKKGYRRNPAERAKLFSKMNTVLTELSSTYVCADAIVKCVQIESFVNNLTAHHYDPIDYVLVENYRQNKNIVFISDDKDFQTDGTIDLITA